jgi:hypothetical protein
MGLTGPVGPVGPAGPQGPKGDGPFCPVNNPLTNIALGPVCFTSHLNYLTVKFDFDVLNAAIKCSNPLIYVEAMLYDADSPYKPYVGTWSSVAANTTPFHELGNKTAIQNKNVVKVPLAVSAELMYEDAEGCHKNKSGFVCIEVYCQDSCQTFKACVAAQKIPGRLDP